MAGSKRKLFERIVYAGLRPTVPGSQAAPQAGALRRFLSRLLTGSTPKDPLYLSNRSWKQKLRLVLLVSAPIVLVLGVASYYVLAPPAPADQRPESLTPAEVAAKTAILPKDFSVPQNTDLQIVEVAVENAPGGSFVAGVLRNNSGVRYGGAELTFDLTDSDGSQVGAASTRVAAIDPKGMLRFRFAVPQRHADVALVREVRGYF
jgi:hypothetical protein